MTGAGPWIVIFILLVLQHFCEKEVENFDDFFKVDYFTGNGVDVHSGEFSQEKGLLQIKV